MNIYIYGLACPKTGVVKYVGKTKNVKRRREEHSHARSPHRRPVNNRLQAWLDELRSASLAPQFVILETCDEIDWNEKERKWIANFGLENLYNKHPGGFQPPPCTGRIISETTRKKLSEAKTKNNAMRGTKTSEDRKKFMREKLGFPIAVLDDNGEIEKTFVSFREAANFFKIDNSVFTRIFNGERKTAAGRKFIRIYNSAKPVSDAANAASTLTQMGAGAQ